MRTPDPKQRWLTFVRNHAKVTVACDFFVVITTAFRTLYVFVVMEIGSRQILLSFANNRDGPILAGNRRGVHPGYDGLRFDWQRKQA